MFILEMKPPKLFIIIYFLILMHSKLFILSIFNLLPFHIWLFSAVPYKRFFLAMCFFSVPRTFSRGISSQCCFFPDFWRACQNQAFAVAGQVSGRAGLAETWGVLWKSSLALSPSPTREGAWLHLLTSPCMLLVPCPPSGLETMHPLQSSPNHWFTVGILKAFFGA